MKPWMRLHIGTDTLQKPSDVQKGDGRMKIKKMILFILFIAVIFSLTGCGKSYEKKIEERYGIEIEGADNDTLKIIDEYFANLPKGFVKELKKYEGIDNRKLHIEIGDETNFYSDIGKGDIWNIKKDENIKYAMGYFMGYSICYNISTRKYRNGLLDEWYDYNPEDFKYGYNEDEFLKYVLNKGKNEEAYFTTTEALKSDRNDAAEIFAIIMDDDVDASPVFEKNPKLRAKAKYLCDEINRAFETADETAYWNRYFK